MSRYLLWIVTMSAVIEAGHLVSAKQRNIKETTERIWTKKSTQTTGGGGGAPALPLPQNSTTTPLSADQFESRLRNKMSRVCYIEKKLRKIFGRRLSDASSNLLRYYESPLPTVPPVPGSPRPSPSSLPAKRRLSGREAYVVSRCSHHNPWKGIAQPKFRHNKTVSGSVKGKQSGDRSVILKGSPGQRPHQRQSCASLKIYVSFSDLGWTDWIVQPKGFVTTVCVGTCDVKHENAYLVLTSKSKCCSPSHFKSLEVLHYNSSGSLNVTILPDLIAARCRCRRC